MTPERSSPSLLMRRQAVFLERTLSSLRKRTAFSIRVSQNISSRDWSCIKEYRRTRIRLDAFHKPRAMKLPSWVTTSTMAPLSGLPSTRNIAESRTHGCRPKNGRARLGLINTAAPGRATDATSFSGMNDLLCRRLRQHVRLRKRICSCLSFDSTLTVFFRLLFIQAENAPSKNVAKRSSQ